MNAIDKFLVMLDEKQQLQPKIAILAYLEYHYENPCLHPDDTFSVDSGYNDVGGLIVYCTHKLDVPAYVEYPTELLMLKLSLSAIITETEIENQHIEVIEDFLEEFNIDLLEDVIYSLNELIKLDKTDVLIRVKEILDYVASV